MADYTLAITTERTYEETVAAVREQLAEAGFGVLTEIDLKATLKAKLDVDVAPQVILGACRPQLAHQALAADPSVAALLPCNVVVREEADGVVVEAFDPQVMISMTDAGQAVCEVAEDARARLQQMLAALADDGARTDGAG